MPNVKFSPVESAFTSSFIGFLIAIVLIKDYLARVEPSVGLTFSPLNKLVAILSFTVLSFLLFFLFSHILRFVTGQSSKYNFRYFGFVLVPLMFFALVNLTAIHEVSQDGFILFQNIAGPTGSAHAFPLMHHPLVSLQVKHFIQGTGIIAGSIISILFCLSELQKAMNNERRNKILAAFSIFLVVITGYSLYVFFVF